MPRLSNTWKNILLLLLGGLLLWLAFRNLPLSELAQKLRHANYWLLFPVFAVTLFGYWVRVKRWNLLYAGLGEQVSERSSWVALCAGYLVSYVIPRAGEITRCLIVKRYHTTPVNKSLATVLVERFTDTLVLFLLVACITVFNVQHTASFFIAQIISPVVNKVGVITLSVLAVAGIAALVMLSLYVKKRSHSHNWIDEFLVAVRQLVYLKNKGMYLLYTCLIWTCYFLMTYIWVFAFDESSHLPWVQVFVIMIVGTIGKSVPIQGGGMGAYHYLVGQAFLFFGIGLVTGNALAIIIHGAQTVYTVFTGASAYLVLMYDEKKRNL